MSVYLISSLALLFMYLVLHTFHMHKMLSGHLQLAYRCTGL